MRKNPIDIKIKETVGRLSKGELSPGDNELVDKVILLIDTIFDNKKVEEPIEEIPEDMVEEISEDEDMPFVSTPIMEG